MNEDQAEFETEEGFYPHLYLVTIPIYQCWGDKIWNLRKLYRVLKEKLHSYGILTQEHIGPVQEFSFFIQITNSQLWKSEMNPNKSSVVANYNWSRKKNQFKN